MGVYMFNKTLTLFALIVLSGSLWAMSSQKPDSDKDVCSICFSELDESADQGTPDNVIYGKHLFGCQHKFHRECLGMWIETNIIEYDITHTSCPYCQRSIVIPDSMRRRADALTADIQATRQALQALAQDQQNREQANAQRNIRMLHCLSNTLYVAIIALVIVPFVAHLT